MRSDCGLPFTATENGYAHLCRRCGVDEAVHEHDSLGRVGSDRRIDGEPVWVFKLKRMRYRALVRLRTRSS